MNSITPREKSPELDGLTAQEAVEVCDRHIQQLDAEIRRLKEKLIPLEEQEVYWIHLKRDYLVRLAPVKKIPEHTSGRRVRKETPMSVEALFASLTEKDRELLLSKLGGQV